MNPETPKIIAGAIPLQGKIRLTKWTASYPVTKQLKLENGAVHKTSSASQLHEGEITRLECTPSGFAGILNGIGSNDCLSYAIPKDNHAIRVLSRKKFEEARQPVGSTTRTVDEMEWPTGPAILMVDYDPPSGAAPLEKAVLLKVLYEISPAIEDVAHIWSVSASSCIFNTETKSEVLGISGQRVYIVVAEGIDIPRAGKILAKRAWLAGYGSIKISRAGSMLVRSVVDDSVFQTNRIDYCAPPICERPLQSQKPKPQLLGGQRFALDTKTALPDLTTEEEVTYQRLVAEEKTKHKLEADGIRTEYLRQRVEKLVAGGMDRDAAEKLVTQAVDHDRLHANYILVTAEGESITVDEVLRDRHRWHGKHFCDPIEPDYHDDHRVARAYLMGPGQPSLYSFAHGGRRFHLSRRLRTLRLQKGERATYMEQMAETFIESGALYSRASGLVAITEKGEMRPQMPYQILAAMDRGFNFEKFSQNQWLATDATIEHAKMFVEAYVDRFPILKSVLTTQNIEPTTGRLLTTPGYDHETAVFLAIDGVLPTVCENPDEQAIEEALRSLWWPVRMFPFATPLDETVMLLAMLTAVNRPLSPTSPAIGFDAPTQASGKTLLIKVLCALLGADPVISPQTDSNNDEEVRKRLFSMLLAGNTAIVFDNIVGEFDSPSLAALLTSSEYSDRVLGKSQTVTVPTNALVLLSGNNLILKGDLPRRVFKCRIDPNMESPHQREFNFDPVEVVRAYRHELVAAALTLFKGYLTARTDKRIGQGRTASFEVWDDLIRQTICWLARLQETGGIAKGITVDGDYFPRLVDPMLALNESVKEDPIRARLVRLLDAWALEIGVGHGRGATVTVKELIAKSSLNRGRSASDGEPVQPLLHDILVEMAGDPIRDEINSRSLGKTLARNKDRVVGGLCLRAGDARQNAATWWVEDTSREFGESDSYPHGKKDDATLNTMGQNKPTKPTKLTPPSATTVPVIPAKIVRAQ